MSVTDFHLLTMLPSSGGWPGVRGADSRVSSLGNGEAEYDGAGREGV